MHVSLNESLIAESKVSSSRSRPAASSTTFCLQHVGNHSHSFAPAYCSHKCSHLPSFPSDFYYKVYLFIYLLPLCSSSPNYGKWEMVSLLYFTFFIVKKALAVDCQNKFLFRANMYIHFFVLIPVFCCTEPAVSPHYPLSFFPLSFSVL